MNSTSLFVATIVAMILYTVGDRLYRFYLFRKRVNKIPGSADAIPFFDIMYDLIMKPKEGAQWFRDRKLPTPAFHFSILDNFAEVMIEKAGILNSCIERQIKIHGDEPFDIFELGAKCALDIICETAMGTDVHAQEVCYLHVSVKAKGIETSKALLNFGIIASCCIFSLSTGAMNRFFLPWLRVDSIFYRTALGKSFKAAIDTAQDVCTRVIVKKQKKRKSRVLVSAEDEVMGKRKRMTFLDLLLEANDKADNPLTMEEIRDQTNAFMFAGHDTTAALFSWTLFCLGNELDVQRKVHEELDDIIGDSDDLTTLKKLPNLKYLERVIKEVLRLYPSLTSVGIKLTEDMQIGDYIVRAGAMLTIQIYQLHRDPEVWPNPLRFDPDRFLPENVKTRHPYAYVPFSAGPRNGIGQKYAMLETKVLLTKILRNFSVKSIEKLSSMKMYSDIILRPIDGIYVSMTKRAIGVEKRG